MLKLAHEQQYEEESTVRPHSLHFVVLSVASYSMHPHGLDSRTCTTTPWHHYPSASKAGAAGSGKGRAADGIAELMGEVDDELDDGDEVRHIRSCQSVVVVHAIESRMQDALSTGSHTAARVKL